MFDYLQVSDPRERRLVAAADAALCLIRPFVVRRPASDEAPARILLLRLERIGDLVMTLPALQAVRRLAPRARIDLVVGGWNAPLARLVPAVDRVLTLDAPWLARGERAMGAGALIRTALDWRRERYDLALNFEGDIRSHLLTALTGARRRVGFDHAGGGPTLTDRVTFDPRRHTTANALGLVARAFGVDPIALEQEFLHGPPSRAALDIDAAASGRARDLLDGLPEPIVAVHAPGGREIKQWPPERFAEVAACLARQRGAAIVLTGSAGDRPVTARVRSGLSEAARVADLTGRLGLIELAAVLRRASVLVTGDTGPMHLAEAVGTPVVAIFGPSDPDRYGPRHPASQVLRVDLPCSPCNRIRMPPARCVGHTPDCLRGVDVPRVAEAVLAVLDGGARRPASMAATGGQS